MKSVSRPTIVCLCGSTKFRDQFMHANYEETMAGRIVLSVGFFMHQNGAVAINEVQKRDLDNLHFRKIDLADEVLVINRHDYIGTSTRREIWYALHHGKRLRMYEYPTKHTLETMRAWFVDEADWERAGHDAATDHLAASQR